MLIKNATIINEGSLRKGSLIVDNGIIVKIFGENELLPDNLSNIEILDASDLYLAPGIIDDQVHFREPGATHKGDIESESKAAVLGGITSVMDMPNNNPPASTLSLLENKYQIAAERAYTNYSAYLGATNDNIDEILAANHENICGVKVFMGSSTGNMLVDNPDTLEEIFKKSKLLIATHCEVEEIIKRNTDVAVEKYGADNIPFSEHPLIRSREACIESSKKAIDLAKKNGTKLHILHISTKEEVDLLKKTSKEYPKISGEVCVHYMWFNSQDYMKYGPKIKCNPAIKNQEDMEAIRRGIKDGVIKVVATDHAPHLWSEKDNTYLKSPSGLPLVQHSFQLMLQLVEKRFFTLEEVVDRMSHSPARLFNIDRRGFVKEGYYADLVLFKREKNKISKENIAYKCGWSPLEGEKFDYLIVHTFVNGEQIVKNGKLTGKRSSMRLKFSQ